MTLSEIVVSNMALSRIGAGFQLTSTDGTLANSTDAGPELDACVLWMPRVRDLLLENLAFPFARSYTTLVLADGGSGEVWKGEWSRAFTYPAGCLKLRRFVADAEGSWSYNGSVPWNGLHLPRVDWRGDLQHQFTIRRHDGARVVLANISATDARVEYTAQVTDLAEWPESACDVLSQMLAVELASTMKMGREAVQFAQVNALRAYQMAAASQLNEPREQQEEFGPFIRARGCD